MPKESPKWSEAPGKWGVYRQERDGSLTPLLVPTKDLPSVSEKDAKEYARDYAEADPRVQLVVKEVK